ncbi:MAG: WG repeat-containing protein [Sphingobacteriales bacterium]|nr:MAG: WG repeat-containing protein [Sphingobacteriales bacterium]
MMNFRSSIKNISLFLISIFISQIASAQTFVPDEALAAVKTNGKWGYIDKTGKLVIPARFESAGVFTEGKAPVKIGMFWGFLDKKGKWAMKPVFTSASNFSNKKALVTVYDNHDSAAVTGYISTVGMLLYELQDYEIGYDYHDQLVRIRSSDNQGLAFGFRDSLGKYVIEPRFDAAMDFSEGMAAIMLGTKWGFTNLNNDYVVVPNYDEAFSFHDGVAYVRAGNKKGYINKKGKMVMNLSSYEEVSPFMYDEMVGVIKNGKAGFVNKKGKLVIKTQKIV